MKLVIMWEYDYSIDIISIPKRIEEKLLYQYNGEERIDMEKLEDIVSEELFNGSSWSNHCMYCVTDQPEIRRGGWYKYKKESEQTK